MSGAGRAAERAKDELQGRLSRLGELTEAARGRLDDDLVERADNIYVRAAQRLGHGTDRTVVALCGATGSGKSSLFNALIGQELARVAVTRPTTSATEAAAFANGAAPLLDWLDIGNRHLVVPPAVAGAEDLASLVLLDLPDHDSTEAAHRAEVERLAEVVDLFVWVVDPQKYADAALHHDFLARYAGHRGVTIVVLNQADRLNADDRRACLDHLDRLLAEDGLHGVRTFAVSALTGDGIDALRRELAARVSEQRAALARLWADVDWLATDLVAAVGDVTPQPVGRRQRDELAMALGRAAGAESVANAVALAHQRNAALATGWPVTRWLRRLRPDPLRRLGLSGGGNIRSSTGGSGSEPVTVSRTNLPRASGATSAAVGAAVRDLVDAGAAGLPTPLRRRVEAAAAERAGDVADALDRAVGEAELPTKAPRWWAPLGALQTVLALCLAAGLVWLAVLFVVSWLQLPDVPTPRLGRVPIPTLLTLGGIGLGLAVATVGRWLARRGGRRRRNQTLAQLADAAGDVGDRLIVEPVDTELAAIAALAEAVHRLQR